MLLVNNIVINLIIQPIIMIGTTKKKMRMKIMFMMESDKEEEEEEGEELDVFDVNLFI